MGTDLSEFASVDETKERLAVAVSKHLLRTRLLSLQMLTALWCLLLAAVYFGTKPHSLYIVCIQHPALLLILLPLPIFFTALVQAVMSLNRGEVLFLDKASNSVHQNSKRVTTLDALQYVEVRRPNNYSRFPAYDPFDRYSELIQMAGWPSLWIIFDNGQEIKLLDTILLMPTLTWPLNANNTTLYEAQEGVTIIANRIANFAGVEVYNQ